jgi:hypothetical protein
MIAAYLSGESSHGIYEINMDVIYIVCSVVLYSQEGINRQTRYV